MNRSVLTRALHGLLMLAVVHQLAVSLLMVRPRPGVRPGNFAFDLHEVVGLAGLGILVLFWIWTLVRRGETRPGNLFPWFSATQRRILMGDIEYHVRSLRAFRLPTPADESPLASATHGLGLLAATMAMITGAIIYFQMAPDGRIPPALRTVGDIHEFFGNVMWVYLVAHAGMALVHQALGHDVLGRMFHPSPRG